MNFYDKLLAEGDIYHAYEQSLDSCIDSHRKILSALQYQLKILKLLKQTFPKLQTPVRDCSSQRLDSLDSESSCVADDECEDNEEKQSFFVCPTTNVAIEIKTLMKKT